MKFKDLLLFILFIVILVLVNSYLYMIPSILAAIFFIKFRPKKLYANIAIIMTIISFIVFINNDSDTPTKVAKELPSQIHASKVTTVPTQQNDKLLTQAGTLPFNKQKQLVLNNFDNLKRATGAHIQLQHKDQPTAQRDDKLKFNPAGWHNYEFYYGDGKNKAWLMNRGHLIGYQFSGLNDEGKNLVPMTAWLNSGNFSGMDDSNTNSMLFYENKLDHWLSSFPDYWLDYKVTPIYKGNELIPRQIELKYVGIDKAGKLIPIDIGGHAKTDKLGVSTVILENKSDNATIDYATGIANNTVAQFVAPAPPPVKAQQSPQPTPTPTPAPPVEEQAHQEQIVEDRIVYVANFGKSQAYWYSTSNMPARTNMSKVVEMSESEAKAMGKHHSKTE